MEMVEKTYYEILGCNEQATYEEIKLQYQQLVKKLHPDKQPEEPSEVFIKIDKAWKTLRDQESRRKYDSELMLNKFEVSSPYMYEEIKLNELDFDKEGETKYPCRCGNYYIINKIKVTSESCRLECDECSYALRIICDN